MLLPLNPSIPLVIVPRERHQSTPLVFLNESGLISCCSADFSLLMSMQACWWFIHIQYRARLPRRVAKFNGARLSHQKTFYSILKFFKILLISTVFPSKCHFCDISARGHYQRHFIELPCKLPSLKALLGFVFSPSVSCHGKCYHKVFNLHFTIRSENVWTVRKFVIIVFLCCSTIDLRWINQNPSEVHFHV